MFRVALIVLLCSAGVFGQSAPPKVSPPGKPLQPKPDAPDEVRECFEKWQKLRDDEKKKLPAEIAELKASIKKTEAEARTRPEIGKYLIPQQQRLRAAEARQKQLARPDFLYIPELSTFDVGEIGQAPASTIRLSIQQVIDAKNAILLLRIEGEPGTRTEREQLLWIKTDTTNWIDDRPIPKPLGDTKVWKITGAQRYNTVNGGSKSIPVIEPFAYEEHLEPKK